MSEKPSLAISADVRDTIKWWRPFWLQLPNKGESLLPKERIVEERVPLADPL
jgi:hypothetical protein